MQKQQRYLSAFILQEFPILRDASVLEAIKCKSENHGNFVCLQNGCEFYPFMCNDKKCMCKKDHQRCLKILTQDFIQKIADNMIDLNVDKIIEENQKKIDEFIQKLISQATNLKTVYKKIVNNKANTTSFTKEQRQILINIQNNKVADLKGKNIAQAYKQTQILKKHSQQNMQNLNKQIQSLQNEWNMYSQKIVYWIDSIKKEWNNKISQQKQKPQKPQYMSKIQNSKIIINPKEQQIMNELLVKKVAKFQLLYRASQNQFKLSNFFKNCEGVDNTLVLIQTQFNKKIGGFTPLKWKQAKHSSQKYVFSDKSGSTFLFSLTNNEKLIQKDENCGIESILNYGPRFSKKNPNGAALAIYQSANIISKSYIQINNGFSHINYPQNKKQQSIERFSGSKNIYFLVKQWQVWKVNFLQQQIIK